MVTLKLFVRLDAKPGKEAEIECFLCDGLPVFQEQPATTAWFAIRFGPSTFGNSDDFPNEAGVMPKATGLFAQPPKFDVLSAELPG